ncbi:fibronectin type III domain-containing protein, partial [Kineococcus glutinatus]|uniref:fibronectin type III domain-containing protein n=1 Tax=Kineococcus glutinatus TaxID=1070872 RepID=UPI0031E71B35
MPLAGLVEPASAAGARIALRVLVVTSGDPSSAAIAAELQREGVPHTVVDLTDAGRPTIDDAFLVDAASGTARFQAVVMPNARPAGMGDAELTALTGYERAHGVRQLNAYVWPGAGSGASALTAGVLDGAAGTVTAQARADGFSALSGSLPIDDFAAATEVYGYLAQVDPELPAGETTTPFITATSGGTTGMIAWEHEHDGREELSLSAASNDSMQWFGTIAPGLVNWMTRGIHLGHQRAYFDVQVDDVFLADSRWSTSGNCTPGDDCVDPAVTTTDVRMTATDVTRLVDWQQANDFRLTMVFNGGGSVAWKADNGGSDPLTDAFLANKAQFPWVNHTYSHPYLGCIQIAPTVAGRTWHCATSDTETPRQDADVAAQAGGGTYWASQEFITSQLQQNVDWARANALPGFDARELVTGEHSGLRTSPQQPADNPFLAPALAAAGVTRIASDASREPDGRAVGAATTVPRYPMNIYYNTATYREQIDEYNWYYASAADGGGGICEDNPASTCITPLAAGTDAEAKASFESYLQPLEVRNALEHVLANDPRPFYAHQSNLAEDGLLYPVVQGVLDGYRATHTGDAPLVQLGLREQGEVLDRMSGWQDSSAAVSAYLDADGVHVSGPAGTSVPLTVPATTGDRTGALSAWGGSLSGWFAAAAGDTVVAVPATPGGGYAGVETAATAPAAPAGVTATAGNASATVSWSAPADGDSPLTGYAVRAYAAGADAPALVVDVPADATSAVVTGLA